jgi:hypothetical protein
VRDIGRAHHRDQVLNPSDATSRYGTGHMNGAILVATGK